MSKPTVSLTYKEDLDAALQCGCGHPDCDQNMSVMYLHGRCHPGGALEAIYAKNSGVLLVRCVKCHRKIAEVVVECRMTQRAFTA